MQPIKEKKVNLIVQNNKKCQERREEIFLNNELLKDLDNKIYINSQYVNTKEILKLKIDVKGSKMKLDNLAKIIFINDNSLNYISPDFTFSAIYVMEKDEATKLKKDLTYENELKKKEKKIFNKVNLFILEAKEEIEKLRTELNELNEQIHKEIISGNLLGHEKKYELIKDKIAVFKNQYFVIAENNDFIEFDYLNDEFLCATISDYKFHLDDNRKIDILAHDCKRNLEVMDNIFDLYKESNSFSIVIDERKSTLEKRDEKFEKQKEELIKIDDINKKITANIELQEKIFDDLKDKLLDIENNKKELNNIMDNMVYLSMLASGITLKNPFLIFGTIILNNMVRGARKKITGKDQPYLKYQKIQDEFLYQNKEINYIYNVINDSINQVRSLKKEFEKELEPYKKDIKEYEELYLKIDEVIGVLESKANETKDLQELVLEQREKSKEKIKKLDEQI